MSLSRAVSDLRREVEERLSSRWSRPAPGPDEGKDSHSQRHEGVPAPTRQVAEWLAAELQLPAAAAEQIATYFTETFHSLGAIPSQQTLVMERFFDESGGMQLVLHSPFGSRINRAWGLALRKRFCRSFNFELQAAATDDAIVISLGTQHSFPLEEVFRYLNSKTVRDLLVQALLDAPMFIIRWRWNATRSLAVPRFRGGAKLAAPLQRMESENLLAAVFPDQLACLEHIVGDREIPDHPLVKQTIEDCLTEAMDIDGLEDVLRKIEHGEIRCIARDLPEPSPLAAEILNARPYAFLDNAPLEERRTQAVYTRRASEKNGSDGLGVLDATAIDKVKTEAWPEATSPDELHDALMLIGVMTPKEISRTANDESSASLRSASWTDSSRGELAPSVERKRDACATFEGNGAVTRHLLEELVATARAARLKVGEITFAAAAERLPTLRAIYPEAVVEPALCLPDSMRGKTWDRSDAIRELVRGRMEVCGPITAGDLASNLALQSSEIDAALLALETEGFVLRGKFHPHATEQEWCDRRLLARIHRLTIDRLRAEIQPVSIQDFYRFLFAWQRADHDSRVEGLEGLQSVLEQLDGYELPLAAWESAVLPARVADYDPEWLDRLCFSGRVGWGRLSPPLPDKIQTVARRRHCGRVRSRFINAKICKSG